MRTLFLLLVMLLIPSMSAAAVVPCVEKNGEKWSLSDDKECVQYTQEQARGIVEKLKAAELTAKELEAVRSQTKLLTESLDVWEKVRKPAWDESKKLLQSTIVDQQAHIKILSSTTQELAKLKNTRSWYQEPSLWFSVGLVAGATVVLVAVLSIPRQ